MVRKQDIIAQLRRDIYSLQGLKPGSAIVDVGLGPIAECFPLSTFPVAAIHEFITDASEDAAATYGFIASILAPLMKQGGTCIWFRSSHSIFPPSLVNFGIKPEKLIFIDLKREWEVLWAAEECLKCAGLAAVIFEIQEISLVASRRLQLAVERSSVTGFVVRYQPRNRDPIASAARWCIKSCSSEMHDGIPGMSFPRWHIELLRVRNGRPGSWLMECIDGDMTPVIKDQIASEDDQIRKIS